MIDDGIAIKVGEDFVDLKPTTTIQATVNNPIFNTELIEGNYSLPFSIGWTDNNKQIFEFIEVVANTKEFYTEKACEVFIQGALFFSGTIRVKKTSTGEYFATLLVTAPGLRHELKNNSLVDVDLGGARQIGVGGNLTSLRTELKDTTLGNHTTFDFVFLPVFNPIAISIVDNPFFASWINQYRSNNFNNSADNQFNEPKNPYPYLVYVFNRIFSASNYSVTGSFFDDDEITSLVVYNNYLVDDPDYQINFDLKNHVPDISQAEFLIRLKKKFNLAYFFNHDTKEIEVLPLKDLLTNRDFDDWTDRVGPKEEVSQEKPATYTLKMAYDTTDAIYPNRYKALEALTIVATVETFADLPVATQQMGDDSEARLVRSINQYWFVFLEPPFAPSWKYHSDNYFDFQVGDDEGRSISIDAKISTLVMSSKTNQISGELQYIPEIRQQCSTDFGDKAAFPFGFSLLFYRGIHASDIVGKNYPLASGHNYDLAEARIAEYSLKMDGDDGIYETWYRAWLAFLIKKKTVVRTNRLTMSELKTYINGGVGWKKKVRIDDVEFIKKTINVTFTMNGISPANVTMYSIPFTPSVPIPAGTLPAGGGAGGGISLPGGPGQPGPAEPGGGGEGETYAERLGPTDPAEGMRIGQALLKGSRLSGINIMEQVRAIYRYDDRHFEEPFTAANFDLATNEITITGHQFINGDALRFVEGAGLPVGVVEGVAYYIIDGGRGADVFKVSATRGGAEIDLSAPAGPIGGDVHSNDFGDVLMQVSLPKDAVIQRSYLEQLPFIGEGPDPGQPTSTALVSFFLENPEDVFAEKQQKNIYVTPTPFPFVDGEQTGPVGDFIKLTQECDLIMRITSTVIDPDDYALVIEYAETV